MAHKEEGWGVFVLVTKAHHSDQIPNFPFLLFAFLITSCLTVKFYFTETMNQEYLFKMVYRGACESSTQQRRSLSCQIKKTDLKKTD